MVLRNELEQYLRELYKISEYEDFCENGLQVEGKAEITRIGLGVSFNSLFLEAAVEWGANAIVVHHGIFQNGFFYLKGILKKKVKTLLDSGINLFAYHLPMDAHPLLGHNALLMSRISADSLTPFEAGFIGKNARGYPLQSIIDIFHKYLHGENSIPTIDNKEHNPFSLFRQQRFTIVNNGPNIPQNLALISGKSSGFYEDAIALGVDTFFCGDIKENTPAISLETGTNFINLGHYFSEKPGLLALSDNLENTFEVETRFFEIPNPI